MRLYVIRHGEPDYANDCLTERGRLQAKALAGRLVAQGVDRVFSSPNGRARETAQPTCDALGLAYTVEDWATEDIPWRDFSIRDANGMNTWAFFLMSARALDDPLATGDRWHEMEGFSRCANAKGGYGRIAAASDGFLKKLGYEREGKVYRIIKPSDEKVALFCHAGMGNLTLSHMLAIPPVVFWSGFYATHSGVTSLDFENRPDGYTAPICMSFSDISHLYKEGLPTDFRW